MLDFKSKWFIETAISVHDIMFGNYDLALPT